jgi:hypothetical protein
MSSASQTVQAALAWVGRAWKMIGVALLWLLIMDAVAALFVAASGIGSAAKTLSVSANADAYFGATWPKEYYADQSRVDVRWHSYSYLDERAVCRQVHQHRQGRAQAHVERPWISQGLLRDQAVNPRLRGSPRYPPRRDARQYAPLRFSTAATVFKRILMSVLID